MASVYLAQHETLGGLHAIKVLDPQLAAHPAIVTRFYNEAIALAKLKHPNLVGVYHVDRLVETGAVYMVLEYLEGESLTAHLAARGRLAVRDAIKLLAGPVSALAKAHRLGAIHRDLKPDNLFLTHGQVKLLDFGVARLAESIAPSPGTKVGTIIGTPPYMAPEQLAGLPVTPAADLYAIAVTLYEMLTQSFPLQQQHETRAAYLGLAEGELMYRHNTLAPIALRERVPEVAPAVDREVMRALSKDPALRHDDIGAFLYAVAAADGDETIDVVREIDQDLVPRSETPTITPAGKRPRRTMIVSASKAESRYEVLDKLGAGGMAEVFRAVLRGDDGFERIVAIKRILPGFDKNPEFYAMFLSEVQLASWLRHPNIVQVLDFSRDANGQPFLAMEYVHGVDLDKLMSSGPVPPSVIIYLLSEICRGLEYAHNAIDPRTGTMIGMLHRDIKPHNVLIGFEGNTVIADFGLAKPLSASGHAFSGTVKGTPAYMSPDQCRGLELDRTTDLWAVGVMLWELLAGEALFHGLPNAVLAQVQFKDIESPSVVVARSATRSGIAPRAIPPDLERIAMKLLVREPRQRELQTAEQLLAALLQCHDAPRDGRGELVRLIAERFPESPARLRSSVPPRSLPPGPRATRSLAPDHSARRRTAPVLLALGAMLLGAGGTFLLVQKLRGHAAVMLDAAPPERAIDAPADTVAHVEPDASVPDAAPPDASTAPPDAATTETKRKPRTPPPEQPEPASGAVVVEMTSSWAYVSSGGKSCQTPCRLILPAGKQRVRVRNPDLKKDETVTVTVRPNETTTVRSPW